MTYKKDVTDTRIANDTYLNAYKPQVVAWYNVENEEVLEFAVDDKWSIKAVTTFADNWSLDSFARLRMSSPHTVFDGSNEYDASPLFFENVLTGGWVVTHLPLAWSINLTVWTTSWDKVVRQSREYFRYIPWKSQLIAMSRVFGSPKANTRQRTWYFDANDWLFFENNGTNFWVVRRTSTSGTPVDNRVAQADFNLDKLDWTWPSGITYNGATANIFLIDFEWLGAGRVRFWFFFWWKIVYCHELLNENIFTVPYMRSGSLPIRHELENTWTSASSTNIQVSCTSVITEDGDLQQTGIRTWVSNWITPISVTTRRAVISIRPKATFNGIVNRADIKEIDYSILAAINSARIEIVYWWTIGWTPSWTSAWASSTIEYDVAWTTVTWWIIIESWYTAVWSKKWAWLQGGLWSKLPLALDIAGANPKNISVVATSMTGTSDVAAALNWLEIY